MLDVGPSMGQAPPGECSALQTSVDAINMILQRKVGYGPSIDFILSILVTSDSHSCSSLFR